METTEIIRILRQCGDCCLTNCEDCPEYKKAEEERFREANGFMWSCGGVLLDAADRLESLDKRWKITRVERDQARQMRERAERLLGLVRSAPVAHGTNYQKIKNMGPLGLTEWILKTVHPCECCDKLGVCGIPEDEVNDEYCAMHILAWLMQEVEK